MSRHWLGLQKLTVVENIRLWLGSMIIGTRLWRKLRQEREILMGWLKEEDQGASHVD